MVAIVIALFIVLLFNAERVVKLLRLDRGYQTETMEIMNLTEESIVKLASIIVGGIITINNFPDLISYTLYALQQENTGVGLEANDRFYWIATLVQVFIGLYLVINYKHLQKLIVKKPRHTNP